MEDEGNGHIPPSALSPRFDRESPVADVRRSRPGPRITAAALLCTVSVLFGPAASGALGPPTVVAVPNPSPANDAEFGVGVAGLEDLNGDGVGDLAVGAPGAGRVDILSGVDRTVLRTIADPGAVVGGGFGFAVADVGDVNGDGRDDVAVGAPGSCFGQLCPVPPPCPQPPCPPPLPDAGRAFVFSGSSGALLHTLAPQSEYLGWHLGFAVAPIGDVSGDGVPDVAVSAPVIGLHAPGEVRAFSGATGAELWVTREPGWPPVPAIPSFGMFLGAVGDLTGDGRPDLLVGAPFADIDPSPSSDVIAGRAHVLSGATGAIIRTHQDPSGEFFGGGVGGVGDQNGDGVGDYAVGDRGAGEVQVFGGTDGTLLHSIAPPGTAAGYSVAGTEDWTGDGVDDLWVGAVGTGTVHLVTGAGAIVASVPDPIADPSTAAAQDLFGWSISVTGDLGADPQRDLMVGNGAEAVEGHPGAGSAYIVLLCADVQAPILAVTASPSVLWPPNHKYRLVVAAVTVTDNVDPSVVATLSSVTSNEPDDGVEDGSTVNDIVIVDDHTFLLRAERSSAGTGRLYTVTYGATDECGNTATATATVSVPINSP